MYSLHNLNTAHSTNGMAMLHRQARFDLGTQERASHAIHCVLVPSNDTCAPFSGALAWAACFVIRVIPAFIASGNCTSNKVKSSCVVKIELTANPES